MEYWDSSNHIEIIISSTVDYLYIAEIVYAV